MPLTPFALPFPRRRTIAAALSVVALVGPVRGQTKSPPRLPDTHAGRLLSEWVVAINSADRAAIQLFLDTRWPGQMLVDNYLARAASTGGYNVGAVLESSDTRVVALLQKRSDLTAYNTITLTATGPNKDNVASLVVGAGTARAADMALAPVTPLSASETELAKRSAPYLRLTEWLQALNTGDKGQIQAYMQASWPSGSPASWALIRERSGGYDLGALEQSTASSLVGTMKERKGAHTVRFTMTLDPNDPSKIEAFVVTPIAG
jgi:hypothetical protein